VPVHSSFNIFACSLTRQSIPPYLANKILLRVSHKCQNCNDIPTCMCKMCLSTWSVRENFLLFTLGLPYLNKFPHTDQADRHTLHVHVGMSFQFRYLRITPTSATQVAHDIRVDGWLRSLSFLPPTHIFTNTRAMHRPQLCTESCVSGGA
jgi:hypothetical protein